MSKTTEQVMQELRQKNLKAVEKANKSEASKERAQKTLTKARQNEKSAVSARDLSWAKMELLCAKNDLDFDKTIKETDEALAKIAEEKADNDSSTD